MVATVAIHQSSSVVAMHQSSSAVWHRQLLLMSVEPMPRFPSSLLPQSSCSSQPRSQRPHRFDSLEVYGLGIEVHVVPSGRALDCGRQCHGLFLVDEDCIAYSNINQIIRRRRVQSIHIWGCDRAFLVKDVDVCLF